MAHEVRSGTSPIPILLHATTAINVANGVIGALNGAAGDSILNTVIILKNGGPATLTIGGFKGEDGTARNVVLTGSTSVDTLYTNLGLRNSLGAMTLTASVADVVLVGTAAGA